LLDDGERAIAPDARHPVDDRDRLDRGDGSEPDTRAMQDRQLDLWQQVVAVDVAVALGRPLGEGDHPGEFFNFADRFRHQKAGDTKRDR